MSKEPLRLTGRRTWPTEAEPETAEAAEQGFKVQARLGSIFSQPIPKLRLHTPDGKLIAEYDMVTDTITLAPGETMESALRATLRDALERYRAANPTQGE